MTKPFYILLLAFGFIAFINTDCKHNPIESATPSFSVTDVSCTEAWLHLSYSSAHNTTVILKRNDIIIDTLLLTTTDTTFADTGLSPSHTYQYTALLDNKTETTTATTMDTTSHNFTWQTYTLGDGTGSNYLNDVAIINDTLAYAVGEIYKDSMPYNVAKWNGQVWELEGIQTIICGSHSYIVSDLSTLFAFNEKDIWYSDGGEIIHWDGTNYTNDCSMNFWLTGAIKKLWGTSSKDLYAIGNNGLIAHYNGTSWSKIESGTTVNLKDVYGTPDGKEVWTCGWNTATGEGIILRIKDSGCETVWHSTQSASSPYNGKLLGSLWTDGRMDFWITGSGDVFRQSITNTNIIMHEAVSLGNYAYRIRGAGRNDITLAGDGAMIWHFNGKTWCKYDNLFNTDNRLYGFAVTSSMAIAVGRAYSTFPTTALIIIGRR